MTDHEPQYKRQLDSLVKVMVILAPLLSAAFAWGITQSQLSSVRENISEIKGWIQAHQDFTLTSVRESSSTAEHVKNMDKSITEIRLMMEKRFR